MQLRLGLLVAAILITQVGTAAADGEIQLRNAYYKEGATRVIQPMLDARLDVGDDGELRPHALVDVITSASAASGAAGGVEFTEKRFEVGASYLHNLHRLVRAGGSIRFSDEPDYTSLYIGLRGIAELADRNTTISAGGFLGSDDMDDSGGPPTIMPVKTEEMNTSLGSVGFSQVLTPQITAGVNYDIAYVRGFQGNLYRRVSAGESGLVEERVPRKRVRHAVFASVRGFLPWTKTMIAPGYRYYRDSWGVISHTPEVRVAQQLKRGIDLLGRYRYYRQTEADFYKEIYDTANPDMEPYVTADQKLAAFRSHWFTLKLDVLFSSLGVKGKLGKASADFAFTYIKTTSAFGNAITGQLAFTYPFDY